MAGDSSIISYILSATDCRKRTLLGFSAWAIYYGIKLSLLFDFYLADSASMNIFFAIGNSSLMFLVIISIAFSMLPTGK